MMKWGQSSVLTFAEKCKNILVSNWKGFYYTRKADAQGSLSLASSEVAFYCSEVKYFVKEGKPYIWVPEKELHNNVNTITDGFGGFIVRSAAPIQLKDLQLSIGKIPVPPQVTMLGDLSRLEGEKAYLAAESLGETLLAEERALKEAIHSVSGILDPSYLGSTSRSASLGELLEGDKKYSIYQFNPSSAKYVDAKVVFHEVNPEEIEKSEANLLSRFSMGLMDGINQSEVRRRALVLFCIAFHNVNAEDALLLSVDRKGFDVLGKVLGSGKEDGAPEYEWKVFRFALKNEARDVENFCQQLLEMEEVALKTSHM